MKRWFVKFGDSNSFYAGNFYGKNEREARKRAREWLRVKRLPNGTEVWI